MFSPASAEPVAQTEFDIDKELVRRFVGGDERAFEEIVARHRQKLFSVAFSFLKNHAEAEDIVQDAFIRASRGLATFRGESSLATWLYRITVNLGRNRYWYHHRRRQHETISIDAPLNDTTGATFAEIIASQESSPSQEANIADFEDLVASCLPGLGKQHQSILLCRQELHMKYEAMAKFFGVNEGTIKSRLARARKKLAQALVKKCPELEREESLVRRMISGA